MSEVFWRKVSFSQEAGVIEEACLFIFKRRRHTEEEQKNETLQSEAVLGKNWKFEWRPLTRMVVCSH